MFDAMQRVYTTEEMLALLEWYREAGVTHAVADVATDWRARGGDAPGKGFKYPTLERHTDAGSPTPTPPQRPTERATPVAPQQRSAPTANQAPPWDVDEYDAQQVPAQRAAPTPAPTRTTQRAAPSPAPRAFPTAAPDDATIAARAAAQSAKSLDDLRRSLEAFDGCALKATAKSLCFYRGAARASLMVIGEAPIREDDMAAAPFVGPPGQLLDLMLAAIGHSEADTHMTNIVYWRPPGNRPPTPAEAQICRPFLERQIELVAPDVVLLLGGTAAKHILNAVEGIVRLRGTWRDITVGAHTARIMTTLGPDFLLKTPSKKGQAWSDLLAVKIALRTPK